MKDSVLETSLEIILWRNTMKTFGYPGSACRSIKCGVIALMMCAGMTLGNVPAAQADPLLDEIVEFTGSVFYIEHKVPALILGVVHNGEMSVRGFGERAGKGSKAPDAQTVMRIGSITKAFNGELLAHMAAGNVVQLAQPLTKSWPELAVNGKADVGGIRLIDLVTHSAGLPREVPQQQTAGNAPPAPATAANYSDWLKKEPLRFKPGTSIHYSNFGFDLLALGLSKASNKPFPDLIKQYITGPLDMKDTVFVLSAEQKKRVMLGHGIDGALLPDGPAGSAIGGAGGLYSTPGDLLKWMQWHLDRSRQNGPDVRLIDHSLYLVRDGLSIVSGMDESGYMDAMGLGWVGMMPKDGRPFILQKAGGLQGTFSYIAFAPSRGVAVFIAINQFDFAAAAAMAVVANDLIATLAAR